MTSKADPPVQRIAFLLPGMGGGGAERVALTLASTFIERGHEVDLVLMEQCGELLDLIPAGVRVVDLKAKRTRNVPIPLMRYFRERQPDAIQISMWPLTIMGIIAARLSRVRVRVVVSDHVTLSRQYGHSPWTMALLKLSTRLFYPMATSRVCVSEGSAADLARISGMGRERIAVVYNPVPGPPGPLTASEAELLWSGAGARILNVGSLKAQKNQALLIRAIALLDKKRAPRLVIMGEGPLRSQLADLANELGIADSVVMPGFVPDLWPIYASAAVFAFSSDYEGFGNVLVEALHAGLPVVSTDCPDGPAEILSQGEFGALVPCGDASALAAAIERALKTPVDKSRLEARAGEFNPDTAAEHYLRLLLDGSTKAGIIE